MRRQLFVLRCLLATFAGLVNRQQANAIDYHYPGVGSMVRIAAVLTVVDRPPAASCFRPTSGSCDVTVPSFGEPAGTTYALQVVLMRGTAAGRGSLPLRRTAKTPGTGSSTTECTKSWAAPEPPGAVPGRSRVPVRRHVVDSRPARQSQAQKHREAGG